MLILIGVVVAAGVVLLPIKELLSQFLELASGLGIWGAVLVIAFYGVACLLFVPGSLVGYLVLNPDIMADIKMAIPFYPITTILCGVALVLRLFQGGHEVGSKNYFRSLYLMLAANIINIIGFTFVAEAPSGEYLAGHPSAFWDYVKNHLRSNADPCGLELAQATFYICFPILLAVSVWGLGSALKQIKAAKGG